MNVRLHSLCTVVACLLLCAAPMLQAQTYPTKAVRVITTDAGGSSDFFLRPFAQDLSKALAQPVVVDNRPGSGAIPGEVVSKAAPDGYTLLFFTMNMWITPLVEKPGYHPGAGFAPITRATRACSVLVITPSLPVKSVKDIISLGRSRPEEIVYAHGSS